MNRTFFKLHSLKGLPLAALVVFGLFGCTKTREFGNRPVLNVDGQELKASVFANQLAEKLRHLDALTAKDPGIVQSAKNDILREFIIGVLTENWSKKNGVFVKAEELEEEISKIRKNYPDDNTFEKALADQNLTFQSWRDSLKKSLLQKKVAQSINQALAQPSGEEIKSYYQANKETFERLEQVKLRQIVLATEADAKVIEDRLKKGASIAELAPSHSITPEGKRSKGELGWIEKGVMEGFDSAFNMRVGARSPVVKSPYGYHIFEVMGKRSAQTLPLTEVETKIGRLLISNREEAAYAAWLESELRRSRVLKDEELIRQIRVETRGE